MMTSQNNLLIRTAQMADAATLATLSRQLLLHEKSLNETMGELTAWAASEAEIRKQLARPNQRFFVAETDGEVIGYLKVIVTGQQLTRKELGLTRWLLDRLEISARRVVNVLLRRPRPNVQAIGGYIAGVFVAPNARRAKVGQQLLAAAETWLRAQGITSTELHVLFINEGARAFWEEAGYKPLTLGMRKKL
ncbi:MAG: GNAT family N-acetyltransferase [Acidobacteria bacterium]|nr:GNAT family N-acetyltransferase [Acidobacteriota bacterium]